MEGIAETHFFGDLFDERPWLMQPLGRAVHFQTEQILIRALMIEPLKEPAEVGGIDVAFVRNLVERSQASKVLPDEAAAFFERSESGGFSTFGWCGQFGGLEGETFQELRANIRAIAR